MNQERLGGVEKQTSIAEDIGWHDKYILEKLDTLTGAIKEIKVETCKSLDKLRDDNASAHKALHEKMDVQKIMCANRPIECQKAFLPTKTFGWLIVVLVVLFSATFSLSGTALKQNAEHETRHALERLEDHEKNVPVDKIDEAKNKLNQLDTDVDDAN